MTGVDNLGRISDLLTPYENYRRVHETYLSQFFNFQIYFACFSELVFRARPYTFDGAPTNGLGD